MNLALGALAVALAAAILAVLFVGDGQDSAGSDLLVPTSAPESATLAPDSGSTTVDLPSPPFQMPEKLDGRWRTANGDTVVQFAGTTIESIQSALDFNGALADLRLAEPALLSNPPSVIQPVQTVVFVTIETDTLLVGPSPMLVEFIATDAGLEMTLVSDGSVSVFILLPG